MKKTFIAILTLIFCSCQKEQQASIVGGWREISVFRKNDLGELNWEPASKFPTRIWLSADGTFGAFNDVPAGNGYYSFDYSIRQITFKNVSPPDTSTYSVSLLNDRYLIIDYDANYKVKFARL